MLVLVGMIALTLLILIIVFFGVYFSADFDQNKVHAERANIRLIDNKGREIENEYLNRFVPYEEINTHIMNAFVALEDKRFFTHKGIDYKRMAGAALRNLQSGYAKEGGSTITQQLAKNTHLSNEKTIFRKIKEMKIAREIENSYKKEDILELYLNAIYYGNGIYGIDAACKKYFGKDPKNINASEAAILAGIVKNPQKYSPVNHSENAQQRMKLVLRLMKEQGYLSQVEYEESLRYSYKEPVERDNGSFTAAVIREAAEVLGIEETDVLRSKYTIRTYYDDDRQKELVKLFLSKEFDEKTIAGNECDKYCILTDNATGGIVCYYAVGKTDLWTKRQPGSTMKPLAVYTPAFEFGNVTQADLFCDEKVDFDGYSPKNFGDTYSGWVDVEEAVKQSINTVAVKIYAQNDRQKTIEALRKCGLPIDEKEGLSVALGGLTYGVSGKELSEGYMTLANGGVHKKISFIQEIRDENGNVIYKQNRDENRVFSEESTAIMTDLLEKTARTGTAKKLSDIPFGVAAKTGTAGDENGNFDSWCMTYTPEYTVCVRYGGEDNEVQNRVKTTGGGKPTALTRAFLQTIGCDDRYFTKPNAVVYKEIDLYAREKEHTLYLANVNTPKLYRKGYWFTMETAPQQGSPYFTEDFGDVRLDMSDEQIKVSFQTIPGYSYTMVKENLYSGENSVLATYVDPEGAMLQYDEIPDKTPIRYRVEVIFDGTVVKKIYSRIVFPAIKQKRIDYFSPWSSRRSSPR